MLSGMESSGNISLEVMTDLGTAHARTLRNTFAASVSDGFYAAAGPPWIHDRAR